VAGVTAFPAEGDLVGDNLACRRGERLIFARLSLIVPPGGAIVLTGPNGSGKSSLLRILASLLAPAAGRLLWNGVPVRDDLPAYRARLHYIGHLDAIKPALGVRETLAFCAVSRGASATAIDRALASFGLDQVADWPSRWLSAGQRRRLALARLAAAPAPLWLLDEPSAALDVDGEAYLESAIAAHRRDGGRVVVATHQPIALPGAGELRLGDFAAAEAPADF
jgi:heme exporter protein A